MKAAKVLYRKKAQSHFNEAMRLNGERDGIEHPDKAADFLLFLSKEENNTVFAAQNGTLPVHTTAFESEYFKGDEYQTYLTYAEDDNYHFVYPCMMYEAYATYKSQVDEVFQKYLSDEITVDDLLEWLDGFWTEAFKTEGKLW